MLDRPAGTASAAPPPVGGHIDGSMAPQALLGALRRRRWAFLVCAVALPLLALVAIGRMTPRYTASGTLIYEPSEYKGRELQSVLRVDPPTEAVMSSQAEILHSLHIAQRVADQIGLFNNPEFNGELRPRGFVARVFRLFRGAPPPEEDFIGPRMDYNHIATLQAVQGALDARTVKFSRVIEVTFTAEDPIVAAAVVNQAMDVYIKDQYAAKHKAVDSATGWLNQRADELRKEVRKGEDAIAAYRAGHGLSQGMHAALDAEQISNLEENLVRARVALAESTAKLDAASGRAGASAQAAIAPSVVPLRTQLGQLQAQAQAQRGRLGPNHPDAVSLQDQLAEARRAVSAEIERVVAAAEAEKRAAQERVETLQHDLDDARSDEGHSTRAQIPLNAMQRDTDALRQQLQAVLERIQQTVQQALIESPEAHEVTQSMPPSSPSWPRRTPLLAAATVLGTFLGLFVVYLLELADTSLRGGEQARTALNLPCFALLPKMARSRRRVLHIDEYIINHRSSPFADQVRAVRARLCQGSARPKVVAVTSACTGEGKTTVALALACSAAAAGERVLAVECDLRRPAFGERLGETVAVGLADCLRSKETPQDVTYRDAVSGLEVIQAGRIGTDAPDLLVSDGMTRMLTELRNEYDLIVLDVPPVLAVTEARIVPALADATVLCVRWGITPLAVVRHALDLLEDAHAVVAGTVLTRVDMRAHSRSGYADSGVYHRARMRQRRSERS